MLLAIIIILGMQLPVYITTIICCTNLKSGTGDNNGGIGLSPTWHYTFPW